MFKTPLIAGSRVAAVRGVLASVVLLGTPAAVLAQAPSAASPYLAPSQASQAYPDPSISNDDRAPGDPLGRPSPYTPGPAAYGQAPPGATLPAQPGAYSGPTYAQDQNPQAGSRYSAAQQPHSYGSYPPAPDGAYQFPPATAGYGQPYVGAGAYPQPRYGRGAAPPFSQGGYPPPPYAEPAPPQGYGQLFYGSPPTLPPRYFAGPTAGSGGCGLPACGVYAPPPPCPVLCAVLAAPPHRYIAKHRTRHHKHARRPCGCGAV